MKTKLLVLLLVAGIAAFPISVRPEPEPTVAPVIGCAIVVVVVGGIVVYGINKICNRLLPSKPKTNAPTNKVTMTITASGAIGSDAPVTNYWAVINMRIESSTNLAQWDYEGTAIGYVTDGSVTFVTTNISGGSITNVAPMVPAGETMWICTNDVHSIIRERHGSPLKFWRCMSEVTP